MKTFKYSFFSRFIYRYGNIFINVVLLFYFIGALLSINRHLIYIIPLAITLLLLYFLNRQYVMMYRLMPYKITVDNEKMICENFLFSNRKVVINFKNIDKLKGGIFEGKVSGMHYVHDGTTNATIGFYDKIKNGRALQTHILHLVDRKVYDSVVQKISSRKQQVTDKINHTVQKNKANKTKKNKKQN